MLRQSLLRPLRTARTPYKPTLTIRRHLTEESHMSPAESAIASTLSSHPNLHPTTSLLVRDVSGGCGSMYAIDIESPKFRGLGLLAQQRLVTKALGEKVKEWHGVQIRTSVSKEES